MNAKELADLIERERGLYMTLDKIFCDLRGKQLTEASKPIQAMLIRALRLLAAAEGGEGTPETDALHHRLVKASEGPQWIAGKDYCDMKDHARTLEQRCNALAARVRELEEDSERLRFIADEPLFDQLGEIDLHEEAAINASAFGRDEPNSNDYLAAIRTAIDAARSK